MNERLQDLLEYAQRERFAIPAFNYSDEWEACAIIESAEELNSPVMIATNMQVISTHGVKYLGEFGGFKAESSKVPVINHLDHCVDSAVCKRAIDAGYKSVMIDGSHLPLDENIEVVRDIVEYGKANDVAVEGEIGRIRGNNAEGVYIGDNFLVEIEDVIKFVNSVSVSSLAVGIGNAHGFYKGKPNLNFRRLSEVKEAVSVPLVLHGGSGLSRENIRDAISNGICKVNVGTHIHYTYLCAARNELNKNPEATNVVNTMQSVKEEIKTVVKEWIFTCMSYNRI